MGDAARVIISNAVIDEILDRNLVSETVRFEPTSYQLIVILYLTNSNQQQARIGNILYDKLASLASRYPKFIHNLRGKGKGTYIAFDTADSSALLKEMRSTGINIGNCGISTIRLRPMLVFEERHISPLLEALEAAFLRLQESS